MTDQDGYYYAKLGSTNLYGLEHPSFRITEELNKIPSFEFEIANCSENRTAIAAGITDVFRIYRRIGITDILMFTGIINGDAIEYLSLERIRITGYASFVDLNWRFHQHLNSADAENVDKVFSCFDSGYTYYKKGAVNATTAGAQSNYQVELVVGESSGSSGADVHCSGHCQNFPNDIRFTKEDGGTKHDYWIESTEGITPNRKAKVIIEVASIPASGAVDFYIYYGNSSASSASDGDNTFDFFTDFGVEDPTGTWEACAGVTNPIYTTTPIEPFHIMKIGSTWYTYFEELAYGYWEITYATSTDGISWTRQGFCLQRGPTGTWDAHDVAQPFVMYAPELDAINPYWLYYIGRDTATNTWDIGLAKSSDGINFTRYGTNGNIFNHDPEITWEQTEVARPFIKKKGTTYYMFYDGANGGSIQIGYATSTDGINWERYANNPVIELGSTGSWDDYICEHPWIIDYKDKWYLFWNGKQLGGAWRIGWAESNKDPSTWTKNVNNPVTSIVSACPIVIDFLGDGTDWRLYYGPVPTKDMCVMCAPKSAEKNWDDVNTPTKTYENRTLKFSSNANNEGITSKTSFGVNKSVRFRIKHTQNNIIANSNGFFKALSSADRATFELRSVATAGYFTSRTISGEEQTGFTYAANTWYICEVARIAGTSHKFWINGSLGDTDTTYIPSSDMPLFFVKNNGGETTLDWVFVRKYVSPEPTWGSWGGEQASSISCVDYTTAANNDTINDVLPTFDSANDALYIGQNEQFFGAQIKYSTKGIQAASTSAVFEYSKGSSVWATLDVLDETRTFTEAVGTHYITIPHKPSDWAKDTVNSVKKFWIRARLSAGSYTTSPALDRIKMTNVDVYRVYYFETAANTIMTDVLAGTGYSMDVTDACPSDTISIVAEYETKLRIIAGIANALTWDDSGDKKAYQWWIDTSKKVHFKQKRGATLGDITGELTILNNIEDYFNLSNRLHFFGNYDGLNQLRAVIENIDSQDTHEIRELAVPEERYNNYIPLKEAAQKAMTYTKAPLQKIAATVTTKYWLDNSFEVGDTVTLHATSWDVASQAFQIVRADIGARVTNLDMGISQEHLDALKAGLQRQLDISGIRMHGSTSLMQFGPETMNYQRVDTTTVYPSRLKIEIPSDVRYIHKVLLSWTIGPYRADVEPDTGPTSGHDHTGYTGSSSAHDHTGATGLDGGHTPTELGKAHTHAIDQHITMFTNSVNCYVITGSFTGYESSHTHSNPNTETTANHRHTIPATDGPDDTQYAYTQANWDLWCEACSAWLIDSFDSGLFALGSHNHLNTGKNTGWDGSHYHVQAPTGPGSIHQHSLPISEQTVYVTPISAELTIALSGSDTPAHVHTINPVPDHTNPITSQAGESLTVATEPGESVTVEYGIHEEAAGTTLELLVNSEVVASSYVGDQTDIRIDGYLSTGNNTVEIRPIVGENDKKGSCTVLAAGIFFIEAKKF